jgi:hypothetical protein
MNIQHPTTNIQCRIKMNVGFSNLYTLKRYVLGEKMSDEPTFNQVLTLIGTGMAATLENFCNRKFARVVGDVEILPADYCQFLLPRFPVETVSAIDLKMTEADGWVSQVVNDFVRTIDLKAGIVYLPDGADAGPYYAQLRFTYTGGYFWDTNEPDDGPLAQPAGSALLPDALRDAWLLQCTDVWKRRDKLGLSLLDKPDEKTREQLMRLLPLVEQNLQQFKRLNLV